MPNSNGFETIRGRSPKKKEKYIRDTKKQVETFKNQPFPKNLLRLRQGLTTAARAERIQAQLEELQEKDQ